MSTAEPGTSREKPETASEPSTLKEMPQTASDSSPSTEEELAQSPESEPTPHEETTHMIVPDEPAESCAVVSGCVNCAQLLKENRQLTNRVVKTLREIVGKRRKEVKVYRRKRKNNNYFVFPLH